MFKLPFAVWNNPEVAGAPSPEAPPAEVPTSAEPSSAEDVALDMFAPMLEVDEPEYVNQPEEILEAQAPVEETVTQVPVTTAAEPLSPTQAATQPVQAPSTPAGTTVIAQQPAAVTSAQPPSAAQVAQPEPTVASSENVLETLSQQVTAHEKVFTEALAKQAYGLSPEELSAIQESPETAIPAMLAKVHVNVTSSMLKVLTQQLPGYVHNLLQARTVNQDRENEFWEANKFLNRSTHKDVVMQAATFVKQTNPQITKADFIAKVGRMAAAMAGVSAVVPQAAPQAQPGVITPGRVVRQVQPTYAPAGANGAAHSAHPVPVRSEWDQLTHLMELDESGAFET